MNNHDVRPGVPIERARLDLIQCARKKARHNSATLLNQHLKKSITRVVLDSDLDVRDLKKVATMFQVKQSVIIDVLRESWRSRLAA